MRATAPPSSINTVHRNQTKLLSLVVFSRKITLAVVVALVTLVVPLSVGLFLGFRGRIENAYLTFGRAEAGDFDTGVQTVVNTIIDLTRQAYDNPEVARALALKEITDYRDFLTLQSFAQRLAFSNRIIRSVEVYSAGLGYSIASTGTTRRPDPDGPLLTWLHQTDERSFVSPWYPWSSTAPERDRESDGRADGAITIMVRLPVLYARGQAIGAIAVGLRPDAFYETIEGPLNSDDADQKRFYVLDSEGRIILSRDELALGSRLHEVPSLREIADLQSPSASVRNVDGVTTFVAYQPSAIPGWEFLVLFPYSSVDTALRGLGVWVIGLSVALSFVAIAMAATLIVRRLRPIHELVDVVGIGKPDGQEDVFEDLRSRVLDVYHRNEGMATELAATVPILREKWMQDALSARALVPSEAASPFLRLFPMVPQERIGLCMVRRVGQAAHEGQESSTDFEADARLRFIVRESLIRLGYEVGGVGVVAPGTLAVLFDFNGLNQSACSRILKELRARAVSVGGDIAVAIAAFPSSLETLHATWKQLDSDLYGRLLSGDREFVLSEMDEKQSGVHYRFPHRLLDSMQANLLSGDSEAALTDLREILGQVPPNASASVIRLFYMTIYVSILQFAADRSLHLNESLQKEWPFDDVVASGVLDRINRNFVVLLKKAINSGSAVSIRAVDRYHDLILSYLNSRYSSDIGLDTAATELHLSQSYINQILRESEGATFKQLLTAKRIDRACKYLRETTLKVNEVSERVGFRNTTYFVARFRKLVGVTPGKYRTGPAMPEIEVKR